MRIQSTGKTPTPPWTIPNTAWVCYICPDWSDPVPRMLRTPVGPLQPHVPGDDEPGHWRTHLPTRGAQQATVPGPQAHLARAFLNGLSTPKFVFSLFWIPLN